MFSKLKQVMDIRDKAKTLQAALSNEKVEGSAGWGKVKISFDGTQRATSVFIDPAALAEKTALEALVKEAINDGMEKLQKQLAGKMKDLGGMDLAKQMQDMMGPQ